MSRYRHSLPQVSGRIFLSDGGMETTFIFHEGLTLPQFASFVLLETPEGNEHLDRYYRRYLDMAARRKVGFVLDTPTWRANPDWCAVLGYDGDAVKRINTDAVRFVSALRDRYDAPATPVVVCGAIGPRGDGYKAGRMSADEATDYHRPQVNALTAAGADMVAGYTLSTAGEAIGIVRAAHGAGIPSAISFTLETDGRLADGTSLRDAIETVDTATGSAAAYFMINCAHPTHFDDVVTGGGWTDRIRGLKANASTRSHAELDEAETLDEGDPADLARRYRSMMGSLRKLAIVGGCCGTDHRHVEAICEACAVPA